MMPVAKKAESTLDQKMIRFMILFIILEVVFVSAGLFYFFYLEAEAKKMLTEWFLTG